MRHLRPVLFSILLLTVSSCSLREREKELQRREASIIQKEQNLLLREEQLALKEADLQQREIKLTQKPDSVIADSLQKYNPAVLGKWYTVMTCTENNCPGSAVGDTKRETWDIALEDNLVVARATVNNKLVRVYTGSWENNRLELTATGDLVGPKPTKMLVNISVKDLKTLEGTRTILRGEECKTLFSLVLTKDSGQPLNF